MGRTIIYDRRYIKVEDKYIPLIQLGSSNTTEFNFKGREVYQKSWTVICRDKALLTEAEIRLLAEKYNEDELYKKSQNVAFKKGEFCRYIINGMKHAQPVEYYRSHGNSLRAMESGVSSSGQYIRSTDELKKFIEKIELKQIFGGSSWLDLEFDQRDLHLPKKRRKLKEKQQYPHYFALTFEKGYFVKKVKDGYRYIDYKYDHRVKKFKTYTEASKYKEKYNLSNFTIEKFEEPAYI